MIDQTSITHLEIDKVQPNPLQPRGMITPDSLMDLVDSIRRAALAGGQTGRIDDFALYYQRDFTPGHAGNGPGGKRPADGFECD